MKCLWFVCLANCVFISLFSDETASEKPAVLLTHPANPQEAFNRLMEGNKRYVQDTLEHPNRNQERREAITAKQFPFATILGCSDSRVSPEIIFDQGVGDLFVVRVAGNVIGPLEFDSIEYSIVHLKSLVILVLGHENCGAVDAVLHHQAQDIPSIAELIEPSVKLARVQPSSNELEKAIKMNALRMKQYLLNSAPLDKLAKEKKIEIQAAYYHLQTGKIEILSAS